MQRKIRILIVDDNIEINDFLEVTLSAFGYEIILACDGIEGLEKAESDSPDLILTDLDMPRMNGIELCKAVKLKYPGKFIPIIVMTANTDPSVLVKSIESGADEFVSKPFDIIELRARIKAMVRIKILEDELTALNRNLEQKVREKTKKIQEMYMETVKSLAKALDVKDHYTKSHSENVTKYSIEIARSLCLPQEEIKSIEIAAQLHDLGKIGISDYILNKKEKLTDTEWQEIKQHSLRSAQILEPLESLNGLVEIVKQHHEKLDGSGYPDGKAGSDIKLGAKILAVADAYDAMTSDRSYRNAFPKEKAIAELKKCSGTQFDPAVVNAFLKVLQQSDPSAQ